MDEATGITADRKPGEGRAVAPADVWAAVQRDYCAGLSAPECSRRHGVGVSTLRARAAQEGWRRSDQDWIAPVRPPDYETADLLEKTGGDLDRIELRELAYLCARRMMQATLDADAVAALRWRRLRLALEAEERELNEWNAAWEYERDARLRAEQEAEYREAKAAAESDASDASDGVLASDSALDRAA